VFVVQRRHEPLAVLFSGTRPVLLTLAATVGIVALWRRSTWLITLDRRYFREAYDAQQILTRFVDELPSGGASNMIARACRELSDALHADVAALVSDDGQAVLRDEAGRWPPVATDTALIGLISSDLRPMDVDLTPGSPLARLPDTERLWLERGGFRLVAPMRRASGGLNGVFAFSAKRSGLPFTAADRRFISAVATAAGLARVGRGACPGMPEVLDVASERGDVVFLRRRGRDRRGPARAARSVQARAPDRRRRDGRRVSRRRSHTGAQGGHQDAAQGVNGRRGAAAS
jgi:hypothetical protein